MQLQLTIDRSADTAIYKQISGQVIEHIEEGELPRGSRLPTVRDLAEQLSVTRVTVHNAYSDLQAEGWIEATVGRGTFVMGPPIPQDPRELVDGRLSPEVMLGDMQRLHQMPGVLSLAMADAHSELFPAAEFLREIQLLSSQAPSLFEYGIHRGDPILRQELSTLTTQIGIPARSEEILVTTGGTEALSMIVQLLGEPGDKVLVEQPTYLGILAILESCGIEAIPVSLDHDGPDLDELETLLIRERPRFFYTVPNFQNPTGVVMSDERRRLLLELADRFALTIIEDDVYGELYFDEPPPPRLKALAPEQEIFYVNSFSKSLLPGLRIGYIVPPEQHQDELLSRYSVHKLCGPPLLHRALAEFVRKEKFLYHLRRARPYYKERCCALLEALEESMPPGVRWTRPTGGLCCWVTLPDEGSFEDLYWAALKRGVAYTPGEVFFARRSKRASIRLCYGKLETNELRRAVEILADLIGQRASSPPSRQEAVCERGPVV